MTLEVTVPHSTDLGCISLHAFSDDQLVTKKELARALSVSERTVGRMVNRFELPPSTRLAGKNIWRVGNIKQWIHNKIAQDESESSRDYERIKKYSI